jgi:hypothetical protein
MVNINKTTILLEETLYKVLVERYGRRNLSKAVNKLLRNVLFKPKKNMYGIDPWLDLEIEENDHTNL